MIAVSWNQLGRKVKKGERGIRILASMIGMRRKKDSEAKQDIREVLALESEPTDPKL